MNITTTITNSFRVLFNLEESFEDMVKAGDYSYVSPGFTKENFPLDAEGKNETEIFFLHFNGGMNSVDVIAEMGKQGLRPATSTHALALGAQHRCEEKYWAFVFLGSSRIDPESGRCRAPILLENIDKRQLDLRPFDSVWGGGCLFAAVRK